MTYKSKIQHTVSVANCFIFYPLDLITPQLVEHFYYSLMVVIKICIRLTLNKINISPDLFIYCIYCFPQFICLNFQEWLVIIVDMMESFPCDIFQALNNFSKVIKIDSVVITDLNIFIWYPVYHFIDLTLLFFRIT